MVDLLSCVSFNVCIDYIKLLATFLDMGLNVDIIASKLNKDNDPANLEWVSSESNISKDSIRYKESKIKKGVVDDVSVSYPEPHISQLSNHSKRVCDRVESITIY